MNEFDYFLDRVSRAHTYEEVETIRAEIIIAEGTNDLFPEDARRLDLISSIVADAIYWQRECARAS